jgi:hypothetical protein
MRRLVLWIYGKYAVWSYFVGRQSLGCSFDVMEGWLLAQVDLTYWCLAALWVSSQMIWVPSVEMEMMDLL